MRRILTDKFLEVFSQAKHICVIAHRNPDLDSLGSASALYSYILQHHKKASFACISENLPDNIDFLPWSEKIRTHIHSSVDLMISVDCGAMSRVGFEFTCKSINIDHHASNAHYGDINIVDVNAISTTQVVYALLTQLNAKINVKMATALYAGLLDDSRRFLHVGKNANALSFGSELIGLGADISACNRAIYQSNSLSSLRLKSLMLGAFELYCEARIAFIHVDKGMFAKSGATPYECEEPLEEMLSLARVDVALLIRDKQEGGYKGSLRSKGALNIGKIAKHYGGGGHINSAGFEVSGDEISLLKESLLELIIKELDA